MMTILQCLNSEGRTDHNQWIKGLILLAHNEEQFTHLSGSDWSTNMHMQGLLLPGQRSKNSIKIVTITVLFFIILYYIIYMGESDPIVTSRVSYLSISITHGVKVGNH